MQSYNTHQYYQTDPNVSIRRFGNKGALLFHAGNGAEKIVNSTGLFLLQRLDGSRSVQDLSDKLANNFDGISRSEVESDIYSFLETLNKEFFIHLIDKQKPSEATIKTPDIQDAPKSVDISVTGHCNLHCSYCFYHNEMISRPDLPLEEWLTFFQELGRLAVRDVQLSGGEVFVRSDIWQIIDAVVDNRMRYTISTNGTLINDTLLSEFEKKNRKERLNSIQVSIDGSCAEVHDRSRGKGTFVKALRGLRLLKDAGFPVTSRVTVNRHNVEDLENVARLLLEEVGLRSFGTNDAMPMGAGCDNQASITLTPRQQVQAMKTLSELAQRYNGRILATAGPLANVRMYRDMEHARATGEKPKQRSMGYLTACGCVFNKLSVHHDGVITPCNMLAKLTLGKMNQDDLSEIWKHHPILESLKNRRTIPMNELSGCEDCEWAPYCNGSCPGLAYEMTGDFNKANPHDCYKKFLASSKEMDLSFLYSSI